MNSDDITRVRAHRATLGEVAFIGITGSCGKTTTKDLATGLLASKLEGTSNPGSGNCGRELVENVLRARPGQRFFIQELGAWGPGTLDAGLQMVQPDVGVVLNVRRDHFSQFRGPEHTAAEKGKVVECLPSSGTAILNADDPHVWDMRHRTRAGVVSFGSKPDSDYRFTDVKSAWPERLSFDLSFQGKRRRVQTQLLGEHLAGSATAAIAIARTLGIAFDDAVDGIASLPPTERRMSAMTTDSGISVVRDDFKCASDSLPELLRFLELARAERKIAVIGRISDYPGRSRAVYTSFAHDAAKVVDRLVFVGERPESLWGESRGAPDFLAEFSGARATVDLFRTVRDAARFLRTELRSGDLLALKGSGPSDHLERILWLHQRSVRCWRANCGLVLACEACDKLDDPAEPDDAPAEARAS